MIPTSIFKRKALPFIVSAMLGALGAAGCSGDKPAGGPPKPGAMTVTVIEMQPQKVPTSIEIMALLQELNRAGLTIVLVTHEHDIAEYAGRIVAFRDGHVVADQPNAPKSAETALAEFVAA